MPLHLTKRFAAAALAATTVLGAGAYAWAENQPADPTPGGPPAAAPGHPRWRHALRDGAEMLGRRAVHGDLIVRGQDGQFTNVTFDRGEVTAVSGSSITVKRPDGVQVTKQINGDTRFRGVDDAGEVVTGKPAMVVSKGDVATVVAQRDPNGNFPGPRGVVGAEGQVPAT